MPELDYSRPYGEMIGVPGVKFEQDGRLFNLSGKEVDQCGRPVFGAPGTDDADEAPPLAPDGSSPGCPFEGMHWKHLKALVEQYGETWTDKATAVAFLRGQASA